MWDLESDSPGATLGCVIYLLYGPDKLFYLLKAQFSHVLNVDYSSLLHNVLVRTE